MLADNQADDSRDFAYGWVLPGVWTTLYHRLTHLRPEEEATLVSVYLTPLGTLEAAIAGAGANLDTDVASVWTRNRSEVNDRIALFNYLRRRMCAFIGIAPGPALAANSAIVRG